MLFQPRQAVAKLQKSVVDIHLRGNKAKKIFLQITTHIGELFRMDITEPHEDRIEIVRFQYFALYACIALHKVLLDDGSSRVSVVKDDSLGQDFSKFGPEFAILELLRDEERVTKSTLASFCSCKAESVAGD